MSNQQTRRLIPKVRFSSRLNISRLNRELKREWEKDHPQDKMRSNNHFVRATEYLDTCLFTGKVAAEPDQVVYQAAVRYLEIRPSVSEEAAQAEGFSSRGRYTGHLVVAELVQPPDDLDQLLKVSKGIELAKIALQNT